jgi:hypothetical protein
MPEEKPAVVEKRHVDAEFRRWCRSIGISESEIARLVSDTAVDESAERPAAVRARRE